MAIKFIDDSILTAIANAIRTKLSSSDTYKPSEMATAIGTISGGGITPTGTINITTNGTTDVTQYASANVAVPASAVDSGTKSISSNGTHDVVGYAAVNVAVPNSYSAGDEGKVVSNGALVAQSSDTVTTNDTYDTTLINSLTVAVASSGGRSATFVTAQSYTNGTSLLNAIATATGFTSLIIKNEETPPASGYFFVGLSAIKFDDRLRQDIIYRVNSSNQYGTLGGGQAINNVTAGQTFTAYEVIGI